MFVRAFVDVDNADGHVVYLNPAHIIGIEKNTTPSPNAGLATAIRTTDGVFFHPSPLHQLIHELEPATAVLASR